MRPPTRTRVRPRVAEVVAVLSMATDLGLGLPMEHAVRTCLISMELGRRLGMSSAELGDLYYLTLLRMLGCTSGSAQYAYFFGDEVAFSRDTQHLDYGDAAGFGSWAMESFAAGRPPDERRQMIERLFSYTPEERRSSLSGHCEVAQMLASRLGFGGDVVSLPLPDMGEHDGWVYSSQPVALHREDGATVIERNRQRVAPNGSPEATAIACVSVICLSCPHRGRRAVCGRRPLVGRGIRTRRP